MGKAIDERRYSFDSTKFEDVEEAKTKSPPTVGVFEIFKFTTLRERCLMLLGIFSALLGGLMFPVTCVMFGELMNSLVLNDGNWTGTLSENDTESNIEDILGYSDFERRINVLGGLVLLAGILQILFCYGTVATFNYSAEKQIYRIRNVYLKSMLHQPISYFDLNSASEFTSRLTENINKIHEGIGEKVGMCVLLTSNCLFSVILSFYYGWELTLVALSTFPLMTLSTAVIARTQTSLAAKEVDEYARAGSVVEEAISAIRTVFAFGGEDKELVRFEKNLAVAKKSAVKRGIITSIGQGMMWLMFYCTFALTFWYGLILISESKFPQDPHGYDPKTLMVVLFGILFGAINIGQTSPYIEAFNIARASAIEIFKMVDEHNHESKRKTYGTRLRYLRGEIDFHGVSFAYPSRQEAKTLNNVNFKIKSGETVALVGSSGSGKSTCVQLLLKFYQASSGWITIDGIEINKLDSKWLYENIGYVKQEPTLFSTTIEENIRLGNPRATTADVVRAAQEASADLFIRSFPKGYNTLVGDRGIQLSGGQKQRIAIARVLMKDPKILLLDEATSALDTQNELLIQNALAKASQGRTTIIIAHRLSTIQNADKIIVMDKGKVVEQGTHQELMDTGEIYKSLVSAQVTEPRKKPEQIHEESNEFADDYTQALKEENDAILSRGPLRLSRGSSFHNSTISLHKKPKRRKPQEDPIPTISMKELLKFARPEWPYIFFGCIGAAIQGCTWPVYAVGFGAVVGALSFEDPQEAKDAASTFGLWFTLLGVVAGLSTLLQTMMFSVSGELFTERVRKATFESMLKQEMGWFDDEKNSVGILCSKLSADAASVHGGTGGRIGTIVQVATTLVVGCTVGIIINWKLGLTVLPFVPLIFFAAQLEMRIFGGQTVTEVKALQQAGKIALEAISNMKTVRSLKVEDHFLKSYIEALHDPHIRTLKKCHLRGVVMGSSQALPLFAYVVVIIYGGYLIMNEGMPFEDMFKVGEALVMGTFMVGHAIAFAPNFQEAKMAAGRIFEIINRIPKIDRAAPGLSISTSNEIEKIQFQLVDFRYPTRPAMPVLDGFTLSIDKGETVALVGQSGSGKSTIVNLLERYYNWRRGAIDINGTDISAFKVSDVRSLFGLVSQEPVLFNRTIFENISYGDNSRSFSREEVERAARQANIHSFIISLPEGYHTLPGSKGARLSGGQKQRIAIARALIRNPKVLLLDEATSALDAENEKIVQETLDEVQKNRTNIIIAHRLSTIKNAQKICVLERGKIVEIGTHEELMNKGERYYHMHKTS